MKKYNALLVFLFTTILSACSFSWFQEKNPKTIPHQETFSWTIINSWNTPLIASFSGAWPSDWCGLCPGFLNVLKTQTGYHYEHLNRISSFASNNYCDSTDLECTNKLAAGVLVSFDSWELIQSWDIQNGTARRIPKLNFGYGMRGLYLQDNILSCFSVNDGVRYDWNLLFDPWTGEVFVKAQEEHYFDMTYPYFNHLDKPIVRFNNDELFPSIMHIGTDDMVPNIGKDDCIIEIWKREHFPDFPITLWSGFEDAIISITREKSDHSRCREILGVDYAIGFYQEGYYCSLLASSGTNLREISVYQ